MVEGLPARRRRGLLIAACCVAVLWRCPDGARPSYRWRQMARAGLWAGRALIVRIEGAICSGAVGCARVAELADAQDLGSCGATRPGSNPGSRSKGGSRNASGLGRP